LITGNGTQGALVYGGPNALRVTLSHERVFLPCDEPLDPPATGAILERLREHCLAGEYQRAADEVVALAVAQDSRYERLRNIDPFIGAATLTFTPSRPMAGEWYRGTDFATGVVTQGGTGIEQRVFASRAHNVVVVSLRGQLHGRLDLGPVAGEPPAPLRSRSTASADALSLAVDFPQRWPGAIAGYVTAVRVIAAGARPCPDERGIELDADHALLLVRTAIAPATAREVLAELRDLPADVDALLAPHAQLHGDLMTRCRLALPGAPGLARLFEAGRYAIISATGELPPTLQGVWSGTFEPPWRSGFTLDGNLATAVAALGPTGTPELLLPVLDLLDAYRDDFRDNARRLYGAPGFLLPPHLSTHGRHNHFGRRWCLTFWTGGAAWAARLYYDYWRYTGDREFLAERAWPFMSEAMSFYEAFAEVIDGRLRLAPSYSPENSPRGEDGPQGSINATHEIAVVGDLARSLIAASAALGRDPSPTWHRLLDALPGYEVGPDGGLREWLWPGLAENHAHRHASHLYGLWYEIDPALRDDESLRRAAATTIRERLRWWAAAGDEMAFGLVSLGLAAAALGLAAEALECARRLTRYWRRSLVATHNIDGIFNTDICGGLPALLVAMLVAGGDDVVQLLPALPADWTEGRIEGVLLRGGVRVEELAWTTSGVEALLSCTTDRTITVTLRGGRPVTADVGDGLSRFAGFDADLCFVTP
jgi:hypothetical protein